jgi:hypothetical protein
MTYRSLTSALKLRGGGAAGYRALRQFSDDILSYQFNFDGLTQYANLSTSITTLSGASFEFICNGRFSSAGFYLTSDYHGSTSRLIITSGGALFVNNLQVLTLNGPQLSYLTNGSVHKLSIKRTGQSVHTVNIDDGVHIITGSAFSGVLKVSALCRQWGEITGVPYFAGRFYDVSLFVNSIKVFENKLNNKTTGAAQASLVGPNLTLINYNAAGWVQV